MSTQWQFYPLTALLSGIVDNRGRTAPTAETGIPLIATNCISNEALYPKYEKVRYVSEETYRTWFRAHPKPGDIIFVNKGTPGLVCLVPDPVDFCIAQDMVALQPNLDLVDGEYLFAVLRSPFMQEQIANLHVGTLIPHVKKGDFDKILIPLPPLEIQEIIGRTYTDFCRKVDLNRRMNITLEATAQTLFNSWFVDFEPVQAKIEGNDTTLSKHIYDLFPDSFEESQLGWIPTGWAIKPLDAIANYKNGLALQNYPAADSEDFLYRLKIRELRQGYFDYQSERSSPEIDEQCIVYDGDIIFSWSGSLLIDIWTGGTGALNQHLFKVTSAEYPRWFYYFWTKHHLEEFQRIAAGKATTMGHIQRHHLAQAMTHIPSEPLLISANEVFSPFIDALIRNRLETRTLQDLRDALLPRLISADMGIQNLEKFLGRTQE